MPFGNASNNKPTYDRDAHPLKAFPSQGQGQMPPALNPDGSLASDGQQQPQAAAPEQYRKPGNQPSMAPKPPAAPAMGGMGKFDEDKHPRAGGKFAPKGTATTPAAPKPPAAQPAAPAAPPTAAKPQQTGQPPAKPTAATKAPTGQPASTPSRPAYGFELNVPPKLPGRLQKLGQKAVHAAKSGAAAIQSAAALHSPHAAELAITATHVFEHLHHPGSTPIDAGELAHLHHFVAHTAQHLGHVVAHAVPHVASFMGDFISQAASKMRMGYGAEQGGMQLMDPSTNPKLQIEIARRMDASGNPAGYMSLLTAAAQAGAKDWQQAFAAVDAAIAAGHMPPAAAAQ